MNPDRLPQLTALSVLLALSVSASAQLTVIYDSGDTQPLAPFLSSLQPVESPNPPSIASEALSQRKQRGPADIRNLLPIRSPGLTPGAVSMHTASTEALKRLALGNARPFFLIGSDPLSQRWLQARRAELQRLGAVGMLIQADTQADVRRIAELAQGLPITLGSASDIATELGIGHYPVLISSRGFEQ